MGPGLEAKDEINKNKEDKIKNKHEEKRGKFLTNINIKFTKNIGLTIETTKDIRKMTKENQKKEKRRKKP